MKYSECALGCARYHYVLAANRLETFSISHIIHALNFGIARKNLNSTRLFPWSATHFAL